MIPRHALSRSIASRTSILLRTPSLRLASTAAASHTTPSSAHLSHSSSALPLDTNLRAILDEPFSNAASSSMIFTPTGLFGNANLQSPQDFITLANATIRRAKAIVARITNAPNAGAEEMRMVVKNFDRLSDVLCGVIDMAELVRHAHPDPEWAEASHDAYEILCSYMNILNTHTGLYEVRIYSTPSHPPLLTNRNSCLYSGPCCSHGRPHHHVIIYP